MTNDQDPILDACLDEVLAGRLPPDLSARVLKELSRRQPDLALESNSLADPLLPPTCDPSPVNGPVCLPSGGMAKPSANRARAARDWRVAAWASAALAMGLVALVTTLGILFTRDRDRGLLQTATQSPEASSPGARPPTASPRGNPASGARFAERAPQATPRAPAPSAVPSVPNTPAEQTPSLPSFAQQGNSSASRLVAAADVPDPLPDSAVVKQINVLARELWTRHGLSPPNRINDAAWRQRAFLVLLGREPTDADLARFSKAGTEDQRMKLVSSLMSSEPYLEEFARHWSERLADLFLAEDSSGEGFLANREGMLQYFRRALLDRRPFDRIAEEMLAATGSGLPGATDYNGAANYLLARGAGKWEHATGDTSRLFLGRSVECLQCHDDLSGGSRQQREFWELNAFFRQLAIVLEVETNTARLANVDFLGEDRKDGHNAVVFFEQLDGLLKGAFPAFPGQGDLPKSGFVGESNRRELLARCVTASPDFRQAIANRLWGAVFGEGLATADNLSLADPTSRALLDQVAGQFAAHRYDPRQVILWGVLSEPFSTPAGDGQGSLAARGLTVFHGLDPTSAGKRISVQESLLAASKSFGNDKVNSATTAKIESVPSTNVKNGKAVLESPGATSLFAAAPVSADPLMLQVLANPRLSNRQKAEHLFQRALHRQPRRSELDLVELLVQKAGDRPETAWNAVWSALKGR